MTLFTNTPFRTSNSQTTTQATPSKPPTPRIPGLGYILFPSPNAHRWSPDIPLNTNGTPEDATTSHPTSKPESQEQNVSEETHPTTEEDRLDSLAQRRRELEAQEAQKGEEDWVRSGGVLRDAQGRRDWVRTQAIREELKLRELERQILERWESYERRWNDIWSKVKKAHDANEAILLRFEDIPWPVKEAEAAGVKGRKNRSIQVEDLTVDRVQEFLLEGLTVRGEKITKKDRVRSSLLRWHPDKLGGLLRRIRPEDTESVRKGVGVVMECLQKLNAQL